MTQTFLRSGSVETALQNGAGQCDETATVRQSSYSRGARLSLPTFAAAQFKRFFDCGRAVRCMVPLGTGRFMHLFVFYGYQGADADAAQLSLTEQLFDAALGELSVVARGQPCLLVRDLNVEPTKIPCLAKEISAGLWVDFEEAWALAAGLQPAPTCKRSWTAAGGHRRDFIVGCPLAAAAVLSCRVQPDRWIAPHLAIRTLFDCCRWSCRFTQPVQRTPLWPASWLPAIVRVGVPSRLRYKGFGRSMMSVFSLCLGMMLCSWMSLLMLVGLVLLRFALADAFRFSGGPVPTGGLVLGRGSAFCSGLFGLVGLW